MVSTLKFCKSNPQGNPEDDIENEPCFDIGDIVRLRRRGSADDDDDDDEDDENIWDDLSKVSGVRFKVIDTSYEEDNSADNSEASPAAPLPSSTTPPPSPTMSYSVHDSDKSYDGDDEEDVVDLTKEDVEDEKEDVEEDAMDVDSDLDENMIGDDKSDRDESDGDSTDEKEKGPKAFYYRLKTVEPHPEFLVFDHFWVREDRLVLDVEAMDVCTDDNEVEENDGDHMEGVVAVENKSRQPWFRLWK